MNTARQYITDVMTRLADPMLFGSAVDYAVGKLDADENTKPPRIDWWYGSLQTVAPTNGNIYTLNQDLIVRVWSVGADVDETETNTIDLLLKLLAAAREVALATFSGVQEPDKFDWSDEQHHTYGRWLEGIITIPISVPKRGELFANITTVGVKGNAVIAGVEEVVCDDNFEP